MDHKNPDDLSLRLAKIWEPSLKLFPQANGELKQRMFEMTFFYINGFSRMIAMWKMDPDFRFTLRLSYFIVHKKFFFLHSRKLWNKTHQKVFQRKKKKKEYNKTRLFLPPLFFIFCISLLTCRLVNFVIKIF